MVTRRIPIVDVAGAPYNPRRNLKPGDPEFRALTKSLNTFGVVEPLVWNQQTGHLVGGHQRLAVLKHQGATEVDVSVVDLSLEQEKALNLALNKIQGGWDDQKLAALLDELLKGDQSLFEASGFEFDEANDLIADVLGDSTVADANAQPPEPVPGVDPVTKPGDLIFLGAGASTAHRLLCGDCTDEEAICRLMDGQQASLFATDPPYLVGYDGTNRPGSSGSPRADWDDPAGQADLYIRCVRAAAGSALGSAAAWYWWHASRNQAMVEQAWQSAGAFIHAQIIWKKPIAAPSRSLYRWQHEPCLMGWVEGHKPPTKKGQRPSTVWEFDAPRGHDRPNHPTPKPVEVFEVPMIQHTQRGDICYEPFAGSGTQFIAAQRLRRRCFGLEISPAYCDLIVRRFIAFAGVHAVSPEVAEKYSAGTLTSSGGAA